MFQILPKLLQRSEPRTLTSPATTSPATRYELKLTTNEIHMPQVRSWVNLHAANFHIPYPSRQINNVYFDTPLLDSYSENTAGISMRQKLRLRWYGNDHNNIDSVLELKCKRSFQGWKRSQKLPIKLNLEQNSWRQIRAQIRAELQPEFIEYFDRYSWPVLINRYQRHYYLSFDGTTRITLDFDITSYDQRLTATPNLHRPLLPNGKMVIEVKAAREDRTFLSEAISALPLRVGKHSKYATAMEAILG